MMKVNIPAHSVLPLQRAHGAHHEEGRWSFAEGNTPPHHTAHEKRLVVIVANPACALSPQCTTVQNTPSTQPVTSSANYYLWSSKLLSWFIINNLINEYEALKTSVFVTWSSCYRRGKHVHLPFSYASAVAPVASVA